MVELEVDGRKVEVNDGSMVMDAANKLGVYVPHFCYHDPTISDRYAIAREGQADVTSI